MNRYLSTMFARATTHCALFKPLPKPLPEPPTSPTSSAPGPYRDSRRDCNTQFIMFPGISTKDEELVDAVTAAVIKHMAHPIYDNSHDFEHVQRVVKLAADIYQSEVATNPECRLDPLTIVLACLVHEIGDAKYKTWFESLSKIYILLTKCGVPEALAHTCQSIARLVSYTYETRHPAEIASFLTAHPELGVVQDADRLDALGIVGLGRCLAYGGAEKTRRKQTIQRAFQLMDERFVHYKDMMKTPWGRDEAHRRWGRMEEVREVWIGETDVAGILK
ncbi:hypothetical protein BU26DRAFT_115945 [Trematosphaeria pertusa]|uniref:HD/PDEase domain-containing protein n=1 Tax=Trematosphaeria pertusa TaxID=390896 RepID=A0A6A6HYN1_9PLEO|nr:uncharacterized protein BU26DRAFT_115945 [Trematosphaeria pertusa]KAF2243325.1 hypothetical protein BU26DRAFT_115945 [Trematosphaeria pertusa]